MGKIDSHERYPLIASVVRSFRESWQILALTDIAYKVIAFVLLTPLVGLFFRVLLAASGREVLADEDILHFLLGPLGWTTLIVTSALWLGIMAWEQAALLAILGTRFLDMEITVGGGVRYSAQHAGPVVRLATRIVSYVLMVALPFLVVAGVTYLALLTKYDINYYLSHQPPEFRLALGIGGLLVVVLAALLLRLATQWFLALPILLFEDVSVPRALSRSRERATGHRRTFSLWIMAWFVGTAIVSAVASGAVLTLGQWTIPAASRSLWLLLVNVGAISILFGVVNLACNLLSSTSFAIILFHLYRNVGGQQALDAATVSETFVPPTSRGFRPTKTQVALAAAVGIVLASAVGVSTVSSVRLEDDVEVTAHRGASAAAPENTLAAVKQAIEEGTDWVEIDVQENADGEVFVFHDSDFKKLAGKALKIWDATSEDLQAIDVGSWFDPKFSQERVPRLTDVLAACRGKARLNIELKYYGHDVQLEQKVVDLVEASGMEKEVVIMSLKSDGLQKLKSLRPTWTAGLLTAVKVGDLTQSSADFLAVSAELATRSFIQSAHDSGKQVYVWTVNDALTMSTMMSRGVDNIITDKPGLAKSVLRQRAELSVPERLLLELAGLFDVPVELGEP